MEPQKVKKYLQEEEAKKLWEEILLYYQEGGEKKVEEFLLSRTKNLKEKIERFFRESFL